MKKMRPLTVAMIFASILIVGIIIASGCKIFSSKPIIGASENLNKPFQADENTFLLWQFDEGQGEAANDSSPGGKNKGKIQNGKWVDGKFGKALEWGEEEGIVTNELPITGRNNMTELTLQAWIYPTKFPNYAGGKSPFSSGLVIWVAGVRLVLWEGPPEGASLVAILSMEDEKGERITSWIFKERYAGGAISSNQWVHIAVSASIPARKAVVFVNGIVAGSGEIPANARVFGLDPDVSGGASVRSHGGGDRFVGKIDSVMASAKFTDFGQQIADRPYSHFLWSGYRLLVLPGPGPASLYNSFKVSIIGPDDEKPLLKMTISKDEFTKGKIMDYSLLPFGPYRVKVVGVKQGAEKLLNLTSFEHVERKEKKIHISDDGITYFRGKPFFPMVLYHVRSKFFEIAKDAGFNAVHPQFQDDVNLSGYTHGDWKDWGADGDSLRGLDLAEKLGLGCFLVPHLAPLSQFAIKYGTKPAYLSYSIGDEQSGGLQGGLKLNAHYHKIRAVDPETPVSYNHNVPAEMNAYSPAADIVGMDPYPVAMGSSSGTPLPLRIVAKWTDAAYDSVGGKKPVWMVLEAFVYRGADGKLAWPLPTFNQLRSMSYMAIARGARGLQYYAFDDSISKTGLRLARDCPEFWEDLKKVVKELNGLSSVWTAPWGTASLQDPSDKLIAARHDFVLNGKHYLLLVNPEDQPIAGDLLLKGLPGARKLTDEFSQVELAITNGKIKVKMSPLQVVLLKTEG